MADDKSVFGILCCAMVLMIVLNTWFWSSFSSDYNFYTDQRPALCVDGRHMEEDLSQSRLGVDDSQRNKGMITMQCSFPVAVYPCLEQGIELDDWDGRCRALATAPMYDQNEWPRRLEKPGIACCERSCMGASRCSDKEWSCSTGSCTAYEKSLRLCSSKMRKEPYKCFTVDGDPSSGVRDDTTGFPAGWLVLGVLAGCLSLLCCATGIAAMSDEENCLGKAIGFLVANAMIFGCVWVIVLIIRMFQGTKDDKGLVESDYGDLAVTTGDNQTAVAVEAPPPEGMHWGPILLIILGSIIGAFCLCLGCSGCITFCSELGWSARAKAVEIDKMKSPKPLTVGDEVILSPNYTSYDPGAVNGVLNPGDVGKVVDFIAGEKGVVVQCPDRGNVTWNYMDQCLTIYNDDLQRGVSHASAHSVFSGKSNRDLARGRSRDELNDLMKTVSGISQAEKFGHIFLNEAEDARVVVKKLNPLQRKGLSTPMPQGDVIGQADPLSVHTLGTNRINLPSARAKEYLADAPHNAPVSSSSTVSRGSTSHCVSCNGDGRQGLLGPVGFGMVSFTCKQCEGTGLILGGRT